MFLFLASALVATASFSEVDQRLSRMAKLYEKVCLKAFPDDNAVETLMAAQGARELSPGEVKVTMVDDPARGWELQGKEATVWIEFPPFHACSIRWNTPEIGDLHNYRIIIKDYEEKYGDFKRMSEFSSDQGEFHIHAIGEQRTLSSQATESLFVIDQQISDPIKREAGETGVVVRFVHQFTLPPSSAAR